MLKKYRGIILITAIALAVSMSLSACGDNADSSAASSHGSTASSDENKDGDMSYASNPESSFESMENNSEAQSEASGDMSSDMSDNSIDSGDVDARGLAEKVVSAYADNYLPDTDMPKELIEGEFGLTEDMYTDIYAQLPAVGFHPDRLVIVKPASGKEQEVKTALVQALTRLKEQSFQYPQNIAKVNAAEILTRDGYYCFMLLGAPDEQSETEEQQAKFAEEQMKIGIDAFMG